ncbi:MAG TPA: vWA domain-containing protein [Gemmatimonadaceae bacterium]|nr:vWA domain-containing protein [Gemmatimonadaceae bacterium]
MGRPTASSSSALHALRALRALRALQRTFALAGIAALLVATAGACGSRSRDGAGDSTRAAANTGVAADRYVPDVEEGLGASVAILIDNSGSMEDRAKGDKRRKYVVAREAIEAMLASTDSFVARQPDFPINVGLYRFSSRVRPMVPVSRYDRVRLEAALDSMPEPDGGTAIGDAMEQAREDLYRAGTFRKYILVVTDGENTQGASPRRVAREIARRSEGAVRMYFVAFDVDADRFEFVREVRGEVVGASNGDALRARLDEIYRGKILSEAVDAGETLPAAAGSDSTRRDSAATQPPPPPPPSARKDTTR